MIQAPAHSPTQPKRPAPNATTSATLDPLPTAAAATPPDAAALELALALAAAALPVALPAVKVPVGSVGWMSVVVVSALRLPREEDVKVLMGPPGTADVTAVTDADAADADAEAADADADAADAAPDRDVAALERMSVDARAEGVSRGAETALSPRAVAVVVTMARERRMVGRVGSIFGGCRGVWVVWWDVYGLELML